MDVTLILTPMLFVGNIKDTKLAPYSDQFGEISIKLLQIIMHQARG